jgi:hypothetical protein
VASNEKAEALHPRHYEPRIGKTCDAGFRETRGVRRARLNEKAYVLTTIQSAMTYCAPVLVIVRVPSPEPAVRNVAT